MNEIYLLFFSNVLTLFCQYNVFLQREDPLIHCLHDHLKQFLTLLMSRLIPVRHIKDCEFSDVQYKDRTFQFYDNVLSIGTTTRNRITELLDEGNVSPRQINQL
eukprot:m.54320 g.54320  ORF g.54320 m.54320 type:complete len:104 (+) comp34346_c0_seq6:1401-1712(+)